MPQLLCQLHGSGACLHTGHTDCTGSLSGIGTNSLSAVPAERGWTVDVFEKRGMPEDKETSRNYALVLHVRGLRALQAAGFDMSSFEHSFQGELKRSTFDLNAGGLQAACSDLSSLEHSFLVVLEQSTTCDCMSCIGQL